MANDFNLCDFAGDFMGGDEIKTIKERSMKRIEKPDICESCSHKFDRWFDYECEPINQLIDGAVEVYAYKAPTSQGWLHAKNSQHRRKALLIGIEPINKETAEDVLRDYVAKFDPDYYETDDDAFWLMDRAKAVLENKE